DGGGQRLQQLELPAVRELAHEADDLAVVDRPAELVARRFRELELDVVEERLARLALALEHAVPPAQLEAAQLDDDAHASAACAAASASTCSRTSCTRRIVGHRS